MVLGPAQRFLTGSADPPPGEADWRSLRREERSPKADLYQVWSLTQCQEGGTSGARTHNIFKTMKKGRFPQTHNQGLRQLLLTVSWGLRT